jgi:ADP-heptose:LPS heptosyltransferase
LRLPASLLERLTRRDSRKDEYSNILILRTAALGDFILSIPALHRLRSSFPQAKLTLITTASTDQATLKSVQNYSGEKQPWIDLLPENLIDEVCIFPAQLSFREILRIRSNLIGKNFDGCFILNEGANAVGIVKKIAFLRILGIRERIFGIRTNAYPKIFPYAQLGVRRLEHHVLELIRSVEECPRVADDINHVIRFDLKIATDVHSWALEFLNVLGCDGAEIIIIAPGSRLEFKKWPEESFAALIDSLLKKRPQAHVLIVGSTVDAETVVKVRSALPSLPNSWRLHDLTGKTSIPQLAALLARASVFVGNDGGTCHLAAAVGCKTVSIANGVEIPNSVEPWGNQRFTARFNPPCAPCYEFTFCRERHRQCVVGIRTDTVLRLAESALSEPSQPAAAPDDLRH